MTQAQLKKLHDLFIVHSKHMAEMAYRYTGDSGLADDLVQEVFLLAAAKMDEVYLHPNAPGWLYQALHNLIKNEMKRAYHHREIPLEEVEGQPDEIGPGLPLPISALLPEGLSDKEKELILLRVEDRLSYSEIAELKGLRESTCRKNVSRAIQECRKLLEQETAGSAL